MKWNPFKKARLAPAVPVAYEVEIGVVVAGGREVVSCRLPGQPPGRLGVSLTEAFVRETEVLQAWAARVQARVDTLQRYVDTAKDRCVEKDKALRAMRDQYEAIYQEKLHWGLQVKHDQLACSRDTGTVDPAEKLAFTAWLNGEQAVLSGKIAGLKLEEQALQARLKSLRSRAAAAEVKNAGKGKAK